MKIYVCVKHVPDSAAQIHIIAPNGFEERMMHIINPYDENAIEEAARIRDAMGAGVEVVAVSVGKEEAQDTLRTAMAMGADRGILVTTDVHLDAMSTAVALKAAILEDGRPDLVFTGKLSIDAEGMQTLFHLAHGLGLPVLSGVVKFTLEENTALVEREAEGGAIEVYRIPVPCVIGAGKRLNIPRYPKLPDIMKARKKPIKISKISDLVKVMPEGGVRILELKPVSEARKKVAFAGGPEEMVRQLVDVIRNEEKVL